MCTEKACNTGKATEERKTDICEDLKALPSFDETTLAEQWWQKRWPEMYLSFYTKGKHYEADKKQWAKQRMKNYMLVKV